MENIISKFTVFVILVLFVLFVFLSVPAYQKWMKGIKSGIETYYSTPPYSGALREVFGAYMLASGRKVVNGIVKTHDGKLLKYLYKADECDNDARVETIVKLNDYLKNKDISMLFVRAPKKVRDNSGLPIYIEDDTIAMADDIVQRLQDSGVDILDLRTEMINQGIDFDTAFYRTEHHWTATTAFWAFGEICKTLNDRYDIQLNPYYWDKANYDFIEHKNVYYGGYARRLGVLYSEGREDFTVITPKFETLFEVVRPETDYEIKGGFDTIFTPVVHGPEYDYIHLNEITNKDNESYQKISNLKEESSARILLVGDSYLYPISTYLACATSHDFLYLTWANSGSPGDLYPMLEEYEYDLVIFLTYDNVLAPRASSPRFEFGDPPQ